MPAWNTVEAVTFDVLRCIRVREKWKRRILAGVYNNEDGSTNNGREFATIEDLILLYRSATIDVVERILEWRSMLPNPNVPFTCAEAENYLLYMVSDLEQDATGHCRSTVDAAAGARWKDVFHVHQVRRNPLLLSKGLDDMADEDRGTPELKQPPSNQSVVCSTLLFEESLYGRAPRCTSTWAYQPTPPSDSNTKLPAPSKSSLRKHVAQDQERNIRVSKHLLKIEKEALARDNDKLAHLNVQRTDVDKERSWIQANHACSIPDSHSAFCGRARMLALAQCAGYTRGIEKCIELVEDAIAQRTKNIARLNLVRRNSQQTLVQLASQRKMSIVDAQTKQSDAKLREMTKMRNRSFAKSRRTLQETNEPLPVIGKKSQSGKCINQRKPVNQEALAGANGQGMLVASQTTRPDKSLEVQLMAYEDLDVTVPLSFEQNDPAPILKTRHQLRFFERLLVPTCIVRGLKLGECDANVVIISKKAQGYTPSGLLFLVVGYQASPSVLSLRLSDTEYDAWGYGRAVSGFELFCRWLCVVYVKRKRRFNLVWCGSACPRPLRARVDDEAVVCIHKEGMKLPSSTSSFGHEYALVAIYLRQTTSTLTFVVASMANHSVVEVSTNIDETIANDFEVCASSCDSAVDVTFRQRRRQRVVSTAVTTYSIGDLTSCPIVFAGSVALTDGPSSHVQVYDSGMNYVVRSTSGGEAPHYATVCKDDVNPLGISLGTQELRAMFADTRVYGVNCAVNVPWLQHCICTYARMFSVARFGIQQHGRYYLVTVVVMQDKLEYRSGLVFRAMQIRGPLGQGTAAVSFSTVLRTTNGLSSVVLGLSAPCSEVTSDDQNSLQASSQQPECGEIMHCQSCLNRICNVLRGGGAVDVCFHQAIPVRVCFSAFCTPESVARLKSCLQQHSSSLNVQTVEDANFGLTGRSVQHYLTEGHWRGLAVFVVPTEEFHLGGRESQDVDLVHRIHDLVQQQHDVAACDASSIDAPNFENYLIAEALVMEATMMCYSASSLKKPSTITGASSWKFACQLLTNPHRFYERFNRHVAWATMSESVATTLLQFQSHPEWKLVDQIDQMKAPFQALYRWLDNGMHLLQAIRDRNGLLSHDFTSPTNAWTVVAVS